MALAVLVVCAFGGRLPGQILTGGTIEGRVANTASGSFLENARITVEGTGLEVFSDETGFFRLTHVPAGPALVRVFFTGMEPHSTRVNVSAGATVQQDISLTVMQDAGVVDPATGAVRLGRYVVAEAQQMEGAAIAINEQRFATNMKTVVAADEFGAASEGDIGEFLKFLPGVSMDYLAGDARQVSIGGVDFNYTPVTLGGFGMTNGNQGGTNRGVSLEYMSLNNVSRVEVINSPMPESPGAALAGSINFVPRSAFERAKPQFTFSAYVSMRDDQRDLGKTVGPREARTHKVLPGVEFSYVVPVNKRFGFSVSGTAFKQFSARDSMVNVWRGANAVTNGVAFPDTTPDRPYLTNYTVRDGFLLRKRSSIALTADYKLGRNDRVSFSITRSTYNTNYDIRALVFAIDRVNAGNFAPTFTRGAAGLGSLSVNTETRDRSTTTFMPTLVYRHDGPVWKAEAGAGYSHSRDHTQSGDRGWFALTTSRRTGVTIAFEDITPVRPGQITVTDGATNAPVDPFNLSTYSLATAAHPSPYNTDAKRSAYANLRRDFDVRGTPVTLKAGFELQNQIRDNVNGYPANATFTFVGRDGRASTTPVGNDDTAASFFNSAIANRPMMWGFPSIPVVSPTQLWAHYQANPSQFTFNADAAYRAPITFSKHIEETISAGYVRGDVAFLKRRLRFNGGVRVEQTTIEAQGPLTDPTRNFQRDAAGNVVRGANGRPLLIVPTTNPLGVSQLTFIERGAKVDREYLRWFPRINAAYNLRDDLIARVAGYQSMGAPNFNQYSGGITLPDVESPPATANRFSANNATIKPWTAWTTSVALEYYFARVGTVSVSAFRREFENFFGTIVAPVTPDFLDTYGLDPDTYGAYDVSTQYNLTERVRMEGFTVNYKQALTFLPAWARGEQVFANGSTNHARGSSRAEFQFSPRLANAGVSLTRARYSARVDVNYRGRQLVNTLTGRSIQAGTERWAAARTSIDVTAEHVLWKQIRLFAKLRNVTDVGVDFELGGPATPDVARFQQRERYGALWTLGVKGTF